MTDKAFPTTDTANVPEPHLSDPIYVIPPKQAGNNVWLHAPIEGITIAYRRADRLTERAKGLIRLVDAETKGGYEMSALTDTTRVALVAFVEQFTRESP